MKLCIVSYSFEQGRRFCQAQGLNFRRAELVSTDANFFLPRGLALGDNDMIIKYGPYFEGKNAHRVLHEIYSNIRNGRPREERVFMYDERIDWPQGILERYAR